MGESSQGVGGEGGLNAFDYRRLAKARSECSILCANRFECWYGSAACGFHSVLIRDLEEGLCLNIS